MVKDQPKKKCITHEKETQDWGVIKTTIENNKIYRCKKQKNQIPPHC